MTLSGQHLNSRFPRGRQRGMAVIVVIAILAIVSVYIVGNLGTLHHLGRDLRLIEQKQLRRLESIHARGSGTGNTADGPVQTIQLVDATSFYSSQQVIPFPSTVTFPASSNTNLQVLSTLRVQNP